MTTHAQRIAAVEEQFEYETKSERTLKAALASAQRDRDRLELENAELWQEVAFLTKQNNQFIDALERANQ
jgi:hypothetical protein